MTRIRTRLLALCCAVLLVAAACSSGAETTTAELPTLADTTSETTPDDDEATDAAPEAEADDASVDESTEDEEEVDPEIAMAEYEKCMEEQGVSISTAIEGDEGVGFETFETDGDVGDTELSSGSFNPEDFEAAAEACDPILEDAFGSFEMTPEQEAEMADQMLELEKCMSDQGFDIDMGGNSFQIDESIDFEAFEAAMSECGNGIFEPVGVDE